MLIKESLWRIFDVWAFRWRGQRLQRALGWVTSISQWRFHESCWRKVRVLNCCSEWSGFKRNVNMSLQCTYSHQLFCLCFCLIKVVSSIWVLKSLGLMKFGPIISILNRETSLISFQWASYGLPHLGPAQQHVGLKH